MAPWRTSLSIRPLAHMRVPVPTHPRSLAQSVDTIGGFGLVFTAVRASIEAGNRQD